MVKKTVFCGTLIALLALSASPAGAKKKSKDPVIPGRYTTVAVPGAESLRNTLFFFHVFHHDKEPVHVGGKTFYVQNAAFLTWTKESTLPADGVLHFCRAAYLMISPPGVPHTPAGVYDGDGDQPLRDINVFTGHATNWPSGNPPGPTVHFKFHGKFNLKKHRIKLTGTCDGVTATRTYKLTKRF